MTSTVPTTTNSGASRRGAFTSSILILSNLVPLLGILFWGWDTFVLLCLYCLETAVIGFWTIARVATMSRDPGSVAGRSIAGTLALAGFFTLHAGLFMTVHMLFIYTLFAGLWAGRIHDARDFISLIVIGKDLWIPLLALFVGQGAIFINDAVNRFVFAKPPLTGADTGAIMGDFYKRIVIMHVAIMGGAFIAQAIGTAAPLIVLVLLKVAIEIRFTMRSKNAGMPVSSPAGG
ncbi:hypothetical protein HNQ36_002980 [Afipia massiliensis]|uniref:Uncharacterized protein n=1 Tax=Afipia massiliensis TaxID=211460 RepID=A0A840MXF8_9BRAD|nr:DUF6498-containing protein [Afipia massiliensis]MBB5052989.1 hypothetical protein [Afipia massiliensis]